MLHATLKVFFTSDALAGSAITRQRGTTRTDDFSRRLNDARMFASTPRVGTSPHLPGFCPAVYPGAMSSHPEDCLSRTSTARRSGTRSREVGTLDAHLGRRRCKRCAAEFSGR